MSDMNYTPDELLSVMLSKESVDAERRGAVKALREAAEAINYESTLLNAPRPEAAAQSWLLDRADEIERTKK